MSEVQRFIPDRQPTTGDVDRPLQRLSGLRAIVTGASRGIGLAIAERFAKEGCAVACLGRDVERLHACVSAITSAGGNALAVSGDLRSEGEIERQVAEAVEGLGGLDVVVNNAGTDADDWGSVHEWTAENFDEMMAVNARAPFLVAKHTLPRLLDGGGGCMLHISSICAVTVWSGDFAYGMSKAALNMLSDHIAVEYATRGIRSNTIMPGAIRTDMFEDVVANHPAGREFERDVLARHPVGRMGTPAEVAALAVTLCSDEVRFMTGSNVVIDGGYSRL